MENLARHILSLSGGKDSAALAIYMRDRVPEMEYIFHDTGKELPETYEYLGRIEAFLGRPIIRTTSDRSFDDWLTVYGGMIPSSHRRWCTRKLKLKPFEDYVGNDLVYNYIGLRADENREGYISHKPNIMPVYPFREAGLVKADIIRILEESGVGLPTFMNWGRTRSGCFFCFFQQKIEWVKLKEAHPDLFEEAKQYEHSNKLNGNAFYWSGDEPLEELEKPERIKEITARWKASQERAKRNSSNRLLIEILGDLESHDSEESCLICHL